MRTTDPLHAIATLWARLPGPPPVRAAALLATLATLVLVLTLALRRLPSNDYVDLFEREVTSAQDLDRIRLAFAREKLNAYRLERHRILVPQDQRAAHWEALRQHQALPRDFYENLRDAGSQGSWFETSREKERRWAVAREQDVAFAIQNIPAVEKAMVLYDETQRPGFPPQKEVTAMVTVVCRPDQQLSLPQVRMIRTMVATAKSGLDPLDVAINEIPSNKVYAAGQAIEDQRDHTLTYLRAKKEHEAYWRDQIRAVLDDIPQARVAVNVQLAWMQLAPSDHGDTVPGHPERIRVLVKVPRSYLEQIWRQRQTSEGPSKGQPESSESLRAVQRQTVERIRGLVADILPSQADADLPSMVAVSLFEDRPAVVTPGGPHWPSPLELVQAHPSMAAGIVGSSSLAVLLAGWTVGHIRRKRPLGRAAAVRAREPLGPRDTRPPVPGSSPDESREALLKLVRQDPDRAARVLNDWIRQAG